MVCVYCGSDTNVKNSRHQKRVNHVWRRRTCQVCDAVFTTIESPDLTQAFTVRRKTYLEPFARETLLISIYDSTRHRPNAIYDATALLNTIVSQLSIHMSTSVIERDALVQIVGTVLERFDTAAVTHYRAFHPLSVGQ